MLPQQKLPINKKTDTWRKDTVDHYVNLSYTSNYSNRNTNYNKKINYDLMNGKFNKADLEYVCNPLGVQDNEFPATLQHYDIVSPAFNLLIGEESVRPDNCIVLSESPLDMSRKQKDQKDRIMYSLQQYLAAQIDPSTIDPKNPPPTPEEIVKYDKYNVSDLVESIGNKLLKHLKKYLNSKEVFKKGWIDALIAGEEIYYVGCNGQQVIFRRCNPLNITAILDSDTDIIDDAIAAIEERMISISTILDEFGDDLKKEDINKLESMSHRLTTGSSYNDNQQFYIDKEGYITDSGFSNFSNQSGNTSNIDLIRVVRVEWKSLKKLYQLKYTDENNQSQELTVDESFKLSDFKAVYPDATIEEFWINEAWEGIKIGTDIYCSIQPKLNQRRRMDDPYYCKLGYTGLIYNSTNSRSVSLMDRLKPYQYLYNIISYRLELAFARDQGKIFLMDLAQIPRSEGIDLEKWMYYLKAMGIGFVNSFEEGRKGSQIGKTSQFNQFTSIDLSLANTIQQYINTLEYIKQQTAFISGVTPQRLGAISSQELVGNVERSVQQSSLITEYLFDSHEEVKRRTYCALIECAKIAYKDGKKIQYILDDMGIELLHIEEGQLEDSELNVYMSRSAKDNKMLDKLNGLMEIALKQDKADLSTLVDTMVNDSPRDIIRTLERAEEAKYARIKQTEEQQNAIQQEQIKVQQEAVQLQLEDKQKDRDLKQYEIDQNNSTKITIAEIGTYFQDSGADNDNNGTPDILEIAQHELDKQDLASKTFLEQAKIKHDKDKHDNEMALKEKELKSKVDIENKKIDAIKTQNESQEKLALLKAKSDKELADKKIKIELIKARNKPKTPKK